jgi:hypothetical protein
VSASAKSVRRAYRVLLVSAAVNATVLIQKRACRLYQAARPITSFADMHSGSSELMFDCLMWLSSPSLHD